MFPDYVDCVEVCKSELEEEREAGAEVESLQVKNVDIL